MTWHKSEEEVDKVLQDMVSRSKGQYITQGVSFNKTCPRQMELLKKALMSSNSFSALAKEALTLRLTEPRLVYGTQGQGMTNEMVFQPSVEPPKKKNIGNFL